jgi:hypothetical protein
MAKDLERIVDFMLGEEVKLTSHLQEKMNRIKRLCSLLVQHTDDTECLELYMELTGVEQAQAYRDLRDAQFIQGNLLEVDRKFERLRLYNKQKKLAQKSEEQGDYKNAVVAIKEAAKIMGFDRAEVDPVDLSAYKGNPIILAFYPELLGVDANGERPDEAEIQKVLQVVSKPRIDFEEDDYSEYEEIREELQKGSAGTPE